MSVTFVEENRANLQRPALRSIIVTPMSGEEAHKKGREGATRAKRWLEGTTRAQVHWVNPDEQAIFYLRFDWAKPGNFSFDIGGVLEGGSHNGKVFVGEVKNYANAQDQGSEFEKFLAKTYRVAAFEQGRCQMFLWVTWAPFWPGKWSKKCSPEEIENAVVKYRERVLDIEDEDEAREALDQDVIATLSQSIWVLVLSAEQEEHLVLDPKHVAMVRAAMTEAALA
jgi:hypothetical protein